MAGSDFNGGGLCISVVGLSPEYDQSVDERLPFGWRLGVKIRMGKYKVYVTRRIPKPGPEFLEQNDCELTFWDSDDAIPHSDLVKNIKADKYDALLCMLTDQVDAAVMDAAGE